jgi:hypothetical protein
MGKIDGPSIWLHWAARHALSCIPNLCGRVEPKDASKLGSSLRALPISSLSLSCYSSPVDVAPFLRAMSSGSVKQSLKSFILSRCALLSNDVILCGGICRLGGVELTIPTWRLPRWLGFGPICSADSSERAVCQ